MKKSRIAVQFILGLFLLALIAAGGCGSSDNAPIPGFYTISGQVTGDVSEGVEIYLSGSASATSTTTDEDGNYSFTVINGNYTVIPVLVGYTFSPVSTAVVVNGANRTGIDFTATTAGAATTYSISGKVTGAVQAGVTITLSGAATGTASTLADGSYIFSNLPAGSYTLTPSSPPTDYTFDPASIDATIVDADIVDQDFTATVVFEQADLEGTWKVQALANFEGSGAWMRFTAEIDEEGYLTISDGEDSVGGGIVPPEGSGFMQWTIDLNGEMSSFVNESYPDAENYVEETYMKGQMTFGKNLFVFTQGAPGDLYSVIIIAQKMVPDTGYDPDELQNQSVVLHQLFGSGYWAYANGSIDVDNNITFSSYISPDGSIEDVPGGDILLDSDGIVLTSAHPTFKGFLSADKKTLVATVTADGDAQLLIFQITGEDFTPGIIPAGTYASHRISIIEDAPGYSDASFWVRSLFTISDLGSRSFSASDWFTNTVDPAVTAPTGYDLMGIIDTSGTVKTTLNSTYHGQMSNDGFFIVGIQTNAYYNEGDDDYYNYYSIGIDIKANAAEPK